MSTFGRGVGVGVRIAVIQVVTLAATVTVTHAVQGYCRAVSQVPPNTFDDTAGCFTGSPGTPAVFLYWSNRCVGYSLQQDASRQVDLATATQAAAKAFGAWGAVDCGGGAHPSIDAANDLGPVACDRVEYNSTQPNQHLIVFRDGGWPNAGAANTLGLTTLRFDERTGEVFDADIEINATAIMLKRGDAGSGVDLDSVLLHEVGHYLGLAHSTDPAAVMHARYRASSIVLDADDIAGICAIYPPDGTRTTSRGAVTSVACDPTPRHGFSSACAVDGGDLAGFSESERSSGCTVARRMTLAPCRDRWGPWTFAAVMALWLVRAHGRVRDRAWRRDAVHTLSTSDVI